MTGYGPQETWALDMKMKFFNTLEEEIVKSSYAGTSVILLGDLIASKDQSSSTRIHIQ